MAGGVDDIDLDAFVRDGHILRENGDAALALQVVVVQDEVPEVLGTANEIGLIDHPVHERRLAVVDVGDDGDVSDVLHISD